MDLCFCVLPCLRTCVFFLFVALRFNLDRLQDGHHEGWCCTTDWKVGRARSVALRVAEVGALEVVDAPDQAVEEAHALFRRFHADELEAQRRPPLLSGLAVTEKRVEHQ